MRKKGTLLLIPASFLLLLVARKSEWFVEKVFSRHIYKVCSVFLNRITGIFPFSVAEMLAAVLTLTGIFCLIRLVVRLVTKSSTRKVRLLMLRKAGLHLAYFLSVVLFLFVFFCGVNYERYPFSYYSGLTIQPSTKEELYELCVSLALRASKTRKEINEIQMTYQDEALAAAAAMTALAEKYSVLSGAYTTPKPLLSSYFFSMAEITGIFIPFTMEANVNVDCTDFTIPATMCHELSHLRGFMREDEANFIAYLACQESDNAYVRYSGLMLALVYTGNQLYKEDSELFYKAREYYSEGVTADFKRDAQYWSQFEHTTVSTVANAVNDTYLKANNQKDGAKSYGRMVDLLLAEWRQQEKGA